MSPGLASVGMTGTIREGGVFTKSEYHKRKAAGQCVYAGCKRKPESDKHGKRRSYCPFHIAANRKNSEAWLRGNSHSRSRRCSPAATSGGVPVPEKRRRTGWAVWCPCECNGTECPVYHFVYHCDREFRLRSVSKLFGPKRNPLI
jgi:hypothetical protein